MLYKCTQHLKLLVFLNYNICHTNYSIVYTVQVGWTAVIANSFPDSHISDFCTKDQGFKLQVTFF